jgi:hypothetical protein
MIVAGSVVLSKFCGSLRVWLLQSANQLHVRPVTMSRIVVRTTVEPLGDPTLRVARIQQMADFTDLVFSQFGPTANCGVEVCWSWDVLPVSSPSNAFERLTPN